MFFETKIAETLRLTVAYHHAGKPGKPKLMLIHGNAVFDQLLPSGSGRRMRGLA